MVCRIGRGRVTAGGKHHPVPGGMLETAENLRREFSTSREAQDDFAAWSHCKAVKAQNDGLFDDEIVPVTVKNRKGDILFDRDAHPRPDTTSASLAKLRPIMVGSDPDATVTAGNASGQNDAASACIVTSQEKADMLGLKPLGRLASWAVAGVEPGRMGIGQVPATERAMSRAGLELKDLDLIGLNEACAAGRLPRL